MVIKKNLKQADSTRAMPLEKQADMKRTITKSDRGGGGDSKPLKTT